MKTSGTITKTYGPNGYNFRLAHDLFFSGATASFCHATTSQVVFKDHRGNYATVIGVKNVSAWLKRHGYPKNIVREIP